MINQIQINNFMENRRRYIHRNEVIDINQIIEDMDDEISNVRRRRSPKTHDEIYYNLLYNETNENNEEEKELELSSLLNEEKMCRICFEGEKFNNELIHPCLCKGTLKYIHLKCLQEWRNININNPEKRDNCEICKYHYAIRERIDYLKYKIPNDIVINTLYFVFLLGVSPLVWMADYYSDFFTIKIFTFFTHENSIIYIKFKKIKELEYFAYDPSIDIYVYSFYIINITLFFLLFIHQFIYKKHFNELNKVQYYKNTIRKYKIFFNICRFSIFYSIYLSIWENNFYILANLVPLILISNILYYTFYLKKHNKLVKNVNIRTINDEYIYSFEENPLILHLGEL